MNKKNVPIYLKIDFFVLCLSTHKILDVNYLTNHI